MRKKDVDVLRQLANCFDEHGLRKEASEIDGMLKTFNANMEKQAGVLGDMWQAVKPGLSQMWQGAKQTGGAFVESAKAGFTDAQIAALQNKIKSYENWVKTAPQQIEAMKKQLADMQQKKEQAAVQKAQAPVAVSTTAPAAGATMTQAPASS